MNCHPDDIFECDVAPGKLGGKLVGEFSGAWDSSSSGKELNSYFRSCRRCNVRSRVCVPGQHITGGW